MKRLKLYVACSLDGKIARNDGRIDWLPDPAAEDYGFEAFYNSIDTTLMGYKTYEKSLSFGEWYHKHKKNYIFSRHPEKTVVPEAQLITEPPTTFVQKLKAEEGSDIWLIGGGEIVTQLHDAGLIDEYIIAFIPLVLGEGIELFPGVKHQVNMTLTQHKVYPNGLVLLYLNNNRSQ